MKYFYLINEWGILSSFKFGGIIFPLPRRKMRYEGIIFPEPTIFTYTNDIIIQGVDNSDDSDNTSSVATAQMPVPTIRGSTRRNEYVNIPLPKVSILSFSICSILKRLFLKSLVFLFCPNLLIYLMSITFLKI